MKTLLRVILMVTVCTVAMSFTNYLPQRKDVNRVVLKKIDQYNIYFTDGRGYQVALSSRGGVFSGNIQTFDDINYGSGPVSGGTCSGTYSIDSSTGNMTISVTYTPSGGDTWSYYGPATYGPPGE